MITSDLCETCGIFKDNSLLNFDFFAWNKFAKLDNIFAVFILDCPRRIQPFKSEGCI
jgi:hypothetical protein